MTSKFDFTGKKILVTGASRGIGRAIAQTLLNAGAHVVCLDVLKGEDDLQPSNNSNGSITTLVGDVTASLSALTELLEPHLPFDALVNNAGIADLQPVGQLTEESFETQLAVNCRGPILLTQIVTNSMRQHGIKGAVVNISSQASRRPLHNHLAYCVSKAALDMATRVMALELGQYGIRLNTVNPTVVFTDMGRALWSDQAKSALLLDQTPLGRFCELEDVVRSVMFLLSSDGASMTTGHTLCVDGGWTTC